MEHVAWSQAVEDMVLQHDALIVDIIDLSFQVATDLTLVLRLTNGGRAGISVVLSHPLLTLLYGAQLTLGSHHSLL